MKIFVLLPRIPYPLEKGDKLRAYNQIKQLSKRHEIVLCALNDKNICPDKEAVFDDCMISQGYCWDAASDFLDQLDLEDGTYVWGNTGNMFLYWWARRNADGTIEQFHEGLETIYNAYFPGE